METDIMEESLENSKNEANNDDSKTDEKSDAAEKDDTFKKPALFQKLEPIVKPPQPKVEKKTTNPTPTNKLDIRLDYNEPAGACLPKTTTVDYSFDVLKNGAIIESINLMKQRYWTFGRLESCHIFMQHPTISRNHAVLQYLGEGNEMGDTGFYLFDLGSTHGTFLNKNRLPPKVYVKMQVGHMLKLGTSTRTYILNGPEEDKEAESELTVTELKQKRAELIQQHEEAERKKQAAKDKEESKGIDWGLGEDADEEVDLSENPYAQTNNEELFIDDPKKALRGFFEREGLDLQYDCSEHGMGQFLCKVELPLDDEMGRPIVAEVLHKGKKKEAVVQCALEACKILDRHGVLRQASHESRKRKAKNWEENDFYDSDEDTFLDRTGTIEKKREKRMHTNTTEKVETYDSLCEQEKAVTAQIQELEKKLIEASGKESKESKETNEEDSLDAYMNQLSHSRPDKISVNKTKSDITNLKGELARIRKLINIVKPASLPPLLIQVGDDSFKSVKKFALPMIGKRKTGKVYLPAKPTSHQIPLGVDDGIDEDGEETEQKIDSIQ